MGKNTRLNRFGRKHLDYKDFQDRVKGKQAVDAIIEIVGLDKVKAELLKTGEYETLSDIRQLKLPNKYIGMFISFLDVLFHKEIEAHAGVSDSLNKLILQFYQKQIKKERPDFLTLGD